MADNEQLVLSISADTRAMQRQLDKLVKQLGDVDTSAGQAFVKAPPKIDAVTKSLGAAKFQTANLAAQFQDIAVSLQGGQSPFTVALQQGTQISQVLGQQGASGAVALLGGAFKSLLSPTSLATIGIIALGGAAIQYGAKAIGAVSDLDEKLKAHGELIKSLKDAYGEVGKGVETSVKESVVVLKTLLGLSTDKLQKDFENLSKSALSIAAPVAQAVDDYGRIIEVGVDKFAPFRKAIDDFNASVKAGQPNVRNFQETISNIIQNSDDEKVKDYGNSLLKATENVAGLERAILGGQKALRGFSLEAMSAAEQGEAFAAAMKKLSNTVTPDLSPREQIMANYLDALHKAAGTEGRLAAARNRDDQLAILRANELKKSIEEQSKAAESAQKRFDSAINSTLKRNAQFAAGTPAVGSGVRALEMMGV